MSQDRGVSYSLQQGIAANVILVAMGIDNLLHRERGYCFQQLCGSESAASVNKQAVYPVSCRVVDSAPKDGAGGAELDYRAMSFDFYHRAAIIH